jgi:hypothetical protein
LVRVWTGMSPMPWCCPFDKPSRETRFCIGTRSQLYSTSGGSEILRMTRTVALVLKILRATY